MLILVRYDRVLSDYHVLCSAGYLHLHTGLTVTEEDHAPRGFLCPITLAVMADPVMASDGQSYDRVAITTWFNSGRDTSPVTNLLLRDRTLLPNHALRNAIEEYLAAPPTGPARVVKGRRKSLRLTEKQQST